MKKQHILYLIIVLNLIAVSNLFAQNTNIKYRCTEIHSYKKIGETENLKYIYLCLRPSNDYQETSNFDAHGGEIFQAPNSNERYVRYTISNPDEGEVRLSYDFVPKLTEYTKAVINIVFLYDTTSTIYQTYITDYYEIFDTNNTYFKDVSETLWKQASDVYDFARKCYDHVEANFQFKQLGVGWMSAESIVANMGGDCGNLATAFINLLRCQKVPARHVCTAGHSWAEFYLEKHGWIPVDPTFHLFGSATSSYGLVISNEVIHYIDIGSGKLKKDYYVSQHHLFYPQHDGYHCSEEIEQHIIQNTNIIQ